MSLVLCHWSLVIGHWSFVIGLGLVGERGRWGDGGDEFLGFIFAEDDVDCGWIVVI